MQLKEKIRNRTPFGMHYAKLSRKTVGCSVLTKTGAVLMEWYQGLCVARDSTTLYHMEKVRNNEQQTPQLLMGQGLSLMSSQNNINMPYIPCIWNAEGHQGPRHHIFKSLDPKGKLKLLEKGKYHTVGKITIFVSLYFLVAPPIVMHWKA